MVKEEGTFWFAACIRNCQSRKAGRTLTDLGVEHYIPEQFRTLLFIRTDKSHALSLVNSGRLAAKYIIDHETRTLLRVPDKQMADFMQVMSLAPESECLSQVPLMRGSRVKVIKGPLKGVEGSVIESPEGLYLAVSVSSLLCAKVEMPKSFVVAI